MSNLCISYNNSNEKTDYIKQSLWESNNRSLSDKRFIPRVHNKVVAAKEHNASRLTKHYLFEVCNENIATKHLDIDDLKPPNILKTKL